MRESEAREAFVRGELAAAAGLAKQAFQAAKAAGDVAAIGRARTLIGHVAYDELRYGPAREAFALACRELDASVGPTHDQAREARAALSLVLACLGDREGAAAALALAEAGLEAVDPTRGEMWVCVACAYASAGRGADARRVLETLAGAIPEADAALLATVHMQLGGTIDALGDRRAAHDSYERCLELRTGAFGDENPRVADAKLAVARSLAALGQIEKAKQMAREAVDCMRRLGLERQPRMSTGWATLGLTLLIGGDVRAATEHFETACKIEEKTFGAAHPATAGMLIMLAQVHASLNDQGKVAGLCKRIIPALKDAPGQEGPLVMACELEVQSLSKMGRAREAAQRVSAVVEAVARRRAATSEQMARLYTALGHAELGAGRRDRGVTALERARALAVDAGASDLAQDLKETLAMLDVGGRMVPKGSA